MRNNSILVGISGFARSGKNLFADIFIDIATKKYNKVCRACAMADPLKKELEGFLMSHYGISPFTPSSEEKNLIRPYMVAHGCGKRTVTDGKYWIEQLDKLIDEDTVSEVILVTDIRFPNEADWLHKKGGVLVHVAKFKRTPTGNVFNGPPNEEEAKNDPIVEKASDYIVEWEDISSSNQGITQDELIQNDHLRMTVEDLVIDILQ